MLWDLKKMLCNLKEMVDIVEIVQAVVMVDIVEIVDIFDTVDIGDIVDIFDTVDIVALIEAISKTLISIMGLGDASASKNDKLFLGHS